jgi:hypothetical protein
MIFYLYTIGISLIVTVILTFISGQLYATIKKDLHWLFLLIPFAVSLIPGWVIATTIVYPETTTKVTKCYPVDSFLNTAENNSSFTLILGCGSGDTSDEMYYIFNTVSKSGTIQTLRIPISDCTLLAKDNATPKYYQIYEYTWRKGKLVDTDLIKKVLILPKKYITKRFNYDLKNYQK